MTSASSQTTRVADTSNFNKPWTENEDFHLCNSWIIKSSSSDNALKRTKHAWQSIVDHFYSRYNLGEGETKRSVDSFISRWSYIHPRLQVFCDCYEEAIKIDTSEGVEYEQVKSDAEDFYKTEIVEREVSEKEESFNLYHCYYELSSQIEWKQFRAYQHSRAVNKIREEEAKSEQRKRKRDHLLWEQKIALEERRVKLMKTNLDC